MPLTVAPGTNNLMGESTPAVTLTAAQYPPMTLGSVVTVTTVNLPGAETDPAKP